MANRPDTPHQPPAICPVCWELRAGRWGCDCDRAGLPSPTTSDEREARVGPWLCHTCQLEIVPGRGRWTMLHCPTCKARVIELNEAAGRLLVPVGIHSLTNRISVRADAPDDELAELVRAMGAMTSIITWLDDYRDDRTRRLCEDLGLDTSAPIPFDGFTRACAQAGHSKESAFAELVTARSPMRRSGADGDTRS